MSTVYPGPKHGHVCPPSDAKHPSDRWEAMFIYSFICKFTNLRSKVEGLETPMDFENALLAREPHPIVTAVLVRFVLNLKPQTRNLSEDLISTTVQSLLSEYMKTSERTVFWSDEHHANIDPFSSVEGGFFAQDWDFKLKVMRCLVELQLTHCADIKEKLDRAWGFAPHKLKKKDDPNPEEYSQEKLQLIPLGQDESRKRYWVADDSPRIYMSTNPWKISAKWQTISSTMEEYSATIEKLKETAPKPPEGKKKLNKVQTAHLALIKALEDRIPALEAELARVQRAQKKIEQKRLLIAQAELRETRTRRQTRKPDYVYSVDIGEDEDEYVQNEDEYEDDYGDDDDMSTSSRSRRRKAPSHGTRRSTRTAVVNANNKREAEEDPWLSWRGERRSARLGAPLEAQLDPEPSRKRARTEESSISAHSSEHDTMPGSSSASHHVENGLKLKATSAAALKPSEVAIPQISGKKASKFWVYAVEPVEPPPNDSGTSTDEPYTNGSRAGRTNGKVPNGDADYSRSASSAPTDDGGKDDDDYRRSMEGSVSPLNSP